MSYNYANARATAERIINKWGKAGQIVLKGTSGGFNDSGNVTPDTPDTVIQGIITPLIQYKTNEVDGKTILKGDSWVFFHGNTEIDVNMQTTVNGKTFRIVEVFPLSSVDDINIFRKLQLRI